MRPERLVINGRFLGQPVTGVQRVAIEFCRALDQMLQAGEFGELDVEIVAPATMPLVTDIQLQRITLRRAGRTNGHLWEQMHLPWLTRQALLLNLGNTAPLLSLLFASRRTYVMVHDLSYKYFPEAYSRAFRLIYGLIVPIVLRRARAVFTVSESERAAILGEYPDLVDRDHIVVAQNGSPRPEGTALPDRNVRRRNCLYVGSLTKRKNAVGLVGAAIRLAREHGVTFTFVGSTADAFEEVDLKIPEDVAGRVRLIGQVNAPAALSAEYLNAAVFLFPSFYEASPLPPIEAMAHGTPVVCSRIPSLEERCGNAAVYCDPDDEDSITRATLSLLDDPVLWAEHQQAGLECAAGYSWENQARNIVRRIRDEVAAT